jgi:phosphatidylinositol-3,4,5-trisphosphate 3-phosphatase/dual-specificity protein phosphatase PTEN
VKYLQKDPRNVIAVHCKAGKGRTGFFICALLMYLNITTTVEESVLYFSEKRVSKGLAV